MLRRNLQKRMIHLHKVGKQTNRQYLGGDESSVNFEQSSQGCISPNALDQTIRSKKGIKITRQTGQVNKNASKGGNSNRPSMRNSTRFLNTFGSEFDELPQPVSLAAHAKANGPTDSDNEFEQ